MTIWRMRIACWITKATNTPSKYVILIPFPLQQCLNESVSMLGYTYIACVVNIKMQSVYCAVRAGFLNKLDRASFLWG
jgi:hypothetical protein